MLPSILTLAHALHCLVTRRQLRHIAATMAMRRGLMLIFDISPLPPPSESFSRQQHDADTRRRFRPAASLTLGNIFAFRIFRCWPREEYTDD